jgi:hypothetical protein
MGKVVQGCIRVFLDPRHDLSASPAMHEAKGCPLLGWRSAPSVRAVHLADTTVDRELARGWPVDE